MGERKVLHPLTPVTGTGLKTSAAQQLRQLSFRTFGGLLMAGLAIRKDDQRFWSRLAHLRSRFMNADAGEGGKATERCSRMPNGYSSTTPASC